MGRTRYYVCPGCGGPMVRIGFADDERWDCLGGCGCTESPPHTRRRSSWDMRPVTPVRRATHPQPEPVTPVRLARHPQAAAVFRAPAQPLLDRSRKPVRSRPWLTYVVAALVVAGVGWGAISCQASSVPGNGSGPGYYTGPAYNGYTVVCRDGWVSNSGGRPGACSHHGGER